jgi:hypothetical protein
VERSESSSELLEPLPEEELLLLLLLLLLLDELLPSLLGLLELLLLVELSSDEAADDCEESPARLAASSNELLLEPLPDSLLLVLPALLPSDELAALPCPPEELLSAAPAASALGFCTMPSVAAPRTLASTDTPAEVAASARASAASNSLVTRGLDKTMSLATRAGVTAPSLSRGP